MNKDNVMFILQNGNDTVIFEAECSEWELTAMEYVTPTKPEPLKSVELTAEFSEYSVGEYMVDDFGEIVGHRMSKIVDGEVAEVRLTPFDS